MCSWGKLWTRYKKDQKAHCYFRKAWSKIRILCIPPAHKHHQRGDKPPKPPLQPNPWTYPYPMRGSSSSLLREQANKGTWLLLSLPPAAAEAPINPCLNFLLATYQFLLIMEAKKPDW